MSVARQTRAVMMFGAASLLGYAAITMLAPSHTHSGAPGFYGKFVASDITGETRSLAEFAGKVTIVVNVASLCGQTQRQYNELQELYNKFESAGLRILAFPCNQFGSQEPGSAEHIEEGVRSGVYSPDASDHKSKYDHDPVTFDLFGKVDVNGPSASPIFTFLKSESGLADVRGNFEKWIIDQHGNVRAHYAKREGPSTMEPIINELLHSEF